MWGKITVAAVGILLGIATELFMPIAKDDENAEKQKHFWAMMFLVFSIVLGLPIELGFETLGRMDKTNNQIGLLISRSTSTGRFQEMDAAYDKNYDKADPLLKGWANKTLDYLKTNWDQGLMPLVKEDAPDQISKAYDFATASVIATNVGGTYYYFHNNNYIAGNTNARDRGVPVIRFYLYSNNPNYHLPMRSGQRPRDKAAFFAEVKDLHITLGSFYSAVIDVDETNLAKIQDVLIMDNKFAAQTIVSDVDWDPVRAVATENESRLEEYRSYLHTVLGVVDKNYVQAMSPADVKKYYGKRYNLSNSDPATDLFNRVIQQIEPSDTPGKTARNDLQSHSPNDRLLR
jgi:hypothetical protein